ncbi:MAG: undecaprenyl-diphosphate phosphatase [Elusimicrobia bacterium]|nr:undecaprenyl-diphosphate phosphatase [Elusimicrobiota bacterium]
MTDYLLASLFGVIEGVTEFLPVSSTAHLRLVKALPFIHIPLTDPYWKMFDVVIQLGAVLCLPIYFRKRIADFLRTFPLNPLTGKRDVLNHPVTLTLIAFFVTAGPAFLLKKVISHNLESPQVIGSALLIGGVVMWVADVLFTKPRTTDINQMNWPQAAWVGAVQILSAVFPGTSRSMSTIASGQTAGLSRSAALEFSFFVSIPTMFVATGYDLLKTLKPGPDEAALSTFTMSVHQWLTLAIGFTVSFFVAWAVVAWFMSWVRRRGFVPFAVYRIVLGLAILFLLPH